MPQARALLRTDRAGRYLAQLCEHAAGISSHKHGQHAGDVKVRRVERSDSHATITFVHGRCILDASREELVLLAEADDEQGLWLIQETLAKRLETIGHRAGLTVTWQQEPAESAAGQSPTGATLLERLMTPAGRTDPFPLYATAHTLGPVSAVTDRLFLVSGYTAVDEILRDPGFGLATPSQSTADSDALQAMNESILRANPPSHGRMRSLIAKTFTPRRIAVLQPAIEQAIHSLLDALPGDGPTDFMERFAFPLPVTVICELLAIPDADRYRFRPLAADLTQALELSGDTTPAADAAARELADYFAHLIAQRRTAPGDDLISAFVAARDTGDGRLTDTELLANLILLLVAGFETTTNLLGNGLAILLDHPDLRSELRSGQFTIEGLVEEVLRYDSPVQAVTRRVLAADRCVQGVPMPQGSDLILLIGAANRDPARYLDPDRFDPRRTDIRPLSFGAGPHICIGNSLARLEATLAFTQLLARYPALDAAPQKPRLRRDRLVLRGYETLPVEIRPRWL